MRRNSRSMRKVFAPIRLSLKVTVAMGAQTSLRRAAGTDFLPTKVSCRRESLFCSECL